VATWIFQGSPSRYNVAGAIDALRKISWEVTAFKREISEGHKVYMWVSGAGAGIVASGVITCDPRNVESLPWMRHFDLPSVEEPSNSYFGVSITLDRWFTQERVSRETLLKNERTNQLTVLRSRGGTNFQVTPMQDEAIEYLIAQGCGRASPVGGVQGQGLLL